MRVTRRQTLKAGLSGLALLGTGSLSSQGRPSVLVIGAGPAGLSTAFELQKQGVDVQVFEARDRVSGRIHTIREPFDDGLYVEGGALFFVDTNPGVDYARELGLELVPPPFNPALRSVNYVGGERFVLGDDSPDRWPDDLPEEDRVLPIRRLRGKYVWQHIDQIEHFDSILSPDLPEDIARRYDEQTVRQFLQSQGVPESVLRLVNLGYLGAYNGGIDHVSVLTLARERASFGEISGAYQVKGGNDQICRAMADTLRTPVKLEHPVIDIEQGDDGVQITVDRHGDHQLFAGDYLVVTAPLSVLAQSNLRNAFSGLRRRAIEEMPSVPATRVFLQTERAFWLDDRLGGGTTDTEIAHFFVHESNNPQSERGVFEGYAYGQGADTLATLSDAERLRRVTTLGNSLYPGLDDYVEKGTSICWGDDPWARGNFVSSRPGQIADFHQALNEPEGRIYLAGDSIGAAPGYSHAAFQSGIDTASKVLARLRA